jgi:hypothetical protein
MCVAFHRFNTALDMAGIEGKQFGRVFVRGDCTDAAIDGTDGCVGQESPPTIV